MRRYSSSGPSRARTLALNLHQLGQHSDADPVVPRLCGARKLREPAGLVASLGTFGGFPRPDCKAKRAWLVLSTMPSKYGLVFPTADETRWTLV